MKGDTDDEDQRSCGQFLADNWVIWVILGLLVAVGATCEIYGAVNGNGDRIRAMASSAG